MSGTFSFQGKERIGFRPGETGDAISHFFSGNLTPLVSFHLSCRVARRTSPVSKMEGWGSFLGTRCMAERRGRHRGALRALKHGLEK